MTKCANDNKAVNILLFICTMRNMSSFHDNNSSLVEIWVSLAELLDVRLTYFATTL